MSNHQPLHDAADEHWVVPALSLRALAGPLSAIAFWLAIAIPALYVPLLATGIEGPDGLALFFGLFGLHLLSLYGGRRYNRE